MRFALRLRIGFGIGFLCLLLSRSTTSLLATLFTCGMYNYTGEWAFRVGVPAKSGVSGGIMGVVNREAGIAVYSPRLDARGNSVRGIAVFRELAEECGLHAFDVFA
jgi:glutaminase